jgi:myo-inositol-1(or 4)-monophosphatase
MKRLKGRFFYGAQMQQTEELCAAAKNAVREAGGIILEHWHKPRTIRFKGRIDLVTATDLAVEEFLRNALKRILPDAVFLGEETSPDASLGKWAWILDPVDGTTNFAHGLPFVATSLGLWHDGKVVAGIVNNPVMGECFWALRGAGAWRQCGGSDAAPVRLGVTTTGSLADALVATGFPYSVAEESGDVLAWLKNSLEQCRGVRRYGAAALDLAYLAAGHYDIFYERGLKPWDTAAGWLLVEEAGGRVTAFDGRSAYAFDPLGILATNGVLHGAAAGLLAV